MPNKSLKMIPSLTILLAALILLMGTVQAQAAITLFEEDFETYDLTTHGWTGDLNNGERWATDDRSVYSGSLCARFDCYNNGNQGDMISPTLDLSQTTDNTLSFWVRSAKRRWFWHDYFNHLYIYVSNDNGNTWTQLDHLTKIESYTYKSYNLDDYILPTNQVKIKFVGQGGNADDNDKDTFVDEVRVIASGYDPTPAEVPTQLEVLQYWAPQVYQDTRDDTVLGYRFYESQDMITKVDFDNDWYAGNNWENFPRNGDYSAMVGHAYASFVESETHYFIGYQYFHATDDAVIEANRHENDMEDVYICIRKGDDPTSMGTFRAMITNRHGDMMQYDSDDLRFSGSHAQIFISSNGDVIGGVDPFDFGEHGHGIENYRPGDHSVGDDGIVYNVADVGEAPTVCDGGAFSHAYDYALVDINELWNRRTNYDNCPFKSYDSFGADGQDSGAHAPWSKQYFQDPATYFADHFSFLTSEGDYSYLYDHNPYYEVTETSAGNPILTLPNGWSSQDIGSPAKAGQAYATRETFTIDGSGSDIWGTTDQFHYVYVPLEGDGMIQARVYSLQQNINAWSKAGVMIRESLAADSAFAMMVVTPDNGASFQYRTSNGAYAEHLTQGGLTAPLWVKLVRQDNLITAYYSLDGNTWQLQGTQTIVMGDQVYVGLAVTSHDADVLCSVTIDNVWIQD